MTTYNYGPNLYLESLGEDDFNIDDNSDEIEGTNPISATDLYSYGVYTGIPFSNNPFANVYAYSLNNPVNFVDPDGNQSLPITILRKIPWNKVEEQIMKIVMKSPVVKQIMKKYCMENKTVAVIHEIWVKVEEDVWQLIHRDFKGPWPK